MMFGNHDGTFTAGPLDVLLILHDVPAGTYHAAFFEEAPMPGPREDPEALAFVRLKSKMHHAGGSVTLEGAKEHLADLAAKIHVPETNLWGAEPFPWSGEVGVVWVMPNWLVTGRPVKPEEIPQILDREVPAPTPETDPLDGLDIDVTTPGCVMHPNHVHDNVMPWTGGSPVERTDPAAESEAG